MNNLQMETIDKPMTDDQRWMSKVIWRAMDDALLPPISKKQVEIYKKKRQSDELKEDRRKKTGGWAKLTGKITNEEIRQSGVDFVMDTAFLGYYRFVFSQTGDGIQGKLKRAINHIKRDPSKSAHYRKIFNPRTYERGEDDERSD